MRKVNFGNRSENGVLMSLTETEWLHDLDPLSFCTSYSPIQPSPASQSSPHKLQGVLNYYYEGEFFEFSVLPEEENSC